MSGRDQAEYILGWYGGMWSFNDYHLWGINRGEATEEDPKRNLGRFVNLKSELRDAYRKVK